MNDIRRVAVGGDAADAPLWRRGLARLVDMGVVFFLLWLLVVLQVLWFMDEATQRLDPAPWGRAFVPLVIFLVLFAIYEVVFLRWNAGQTPGKQHFGVRVVVMADGADPSLARAVGRWVIPGLVLLAWPLWLGLALLGLTAVTLPFGPGRRAIHDRVAGTRIVRYVHVEESDDEADDGNVDDEDGVGTPLTITSFLIGRPTRRGLRPRTPREAERTLDRG